MYLLPKIIPKILVHQSKIELKESRLLSKAFNRAAVPFLFDRIFVIARYADIERATLLASRFGPFVKTLIFCSEYFEPTITLETFTFGAADISLAMSYYASFCTLREEQQELLNEGEFFGHLCSTLIALTNLDKVILTNVSHTRGLCWCQQAYIDGSFRTFEPWSDDGYPGLKLLRPAPDHRCVESTNGLEHTDSNSWPELLRALYTSGNTRVKTIVIDGGNDSSGLVISAFCMTLRQRFCAAKVLPNLTSLNLQLGARFTEDARYEVYWERAVAQTLSAAINLETLLIEIIDAWEMFDHFETVLGGCKMPKLMTLGLKRFTVTEAGMKTFLHDSQGIRRMSLDDVEMVIGSWVHIFQMIKDELSLESFESRGLRGGIVKIVGAGFDGQRYEPSTAVKEFLFGDGINPYSKAALEAALGIPETSDEIFRDLFRC